jgi:hypothetical protein
MDLLKSMIANRQAMGVTPASDPKPRKQNARKGPTKAERAKENMPGSKAMRKFICEEKPGKKVVKEHLEAFLVESSSDEE